MLFSGHAFFIVLIWNYDHFPVSKHVHNTLPLSFETFASKHFETFRYRCWFCSRRPTLRTLPAQTSFFIEH